MSALFETGFFVRQPAWHKQGTVLEDIPDTREAFVASGLDWKVELQQLLRRVPGFNRAFPTDHYAISRDSDNAILGYASDRYTPYQNEQAFEWSRPLVESGYWTWETAGSLVGGKICWGLLKQAEEQVIPNDMIKDYLMMTWSHDGSKAVTVQPTSIRVVCNNTLQMALNDGQALAKVRHHSQVAMRLEEVKDLHNLTGDLFADQRETFKKLLDLKLKDTEIEEIIDSTYIVDEENPTTSSQRKNELVKTLAFGEASGHRDLGIKNTGYGLMMAASEANEHFLGGARIKDRGKNILFGKGRKTNNLVFSKIMAKVA